MTMPMQHLTPWLGSGGVTDAGGGRLAVQGVGAEPVTVELRTTGTGHELCAMWSAPPEAAGLDLAPVARSTALARPGALRCEARPGAVLIAAPLFLDGLTQQLFLATAHDVAKAYELLNTAFPRPEPARPEAEQPEAEQPEPAQPEPAQPEPAQPEPAQPEPADPPSLIKPAPADAPDLPRPVSTVPISDALTVAVPDPGPQSAPPAEAPATAQWRRTHVLPPEGQQAWAAPDFAAPSVQAPGGYEVQVLEQRGEWAHVAGRDGWTGWLEARRLVPAASA